MREVLVLILFLLASCSSVPGNSSNSYLHTSSNRDKNMTTTGMENPKIWRQFNQLYQSIQAEKNKNKIESFFDKTDDWEFGWQKIDNEVISKLALILIDEIKRKKEQLRNKPGRQPATDWFKNLAGHLTRMNNELAVLQALTGFDDEPGQDFMTTIKLIRQSLEFSTQLVTGDQDQITKRLAAGELQLNQQQELLVNLSKDSLNVAISLLK